MSKKRRNSKKKKAAKWRKNRKREIARQKKQHEVLNNKRNSADEFESRKYCQKCWFRKSVVIFMCIFFLGIGFILSNQNTVQEIPDWYEAGPVIGIASDRPLKGAYVNVATDENGKTRILIRGTELEDVLPESFKREAESKGHVVEKSNESKERQGVTHLWVYLLSKNTPVGWSINEQIGNIENYQVVLRSTIDKYEVKESNEFQGVDYTTVFKINYGDDYLGIAEIDIFQPEEHIMYSTNGICMPVLPKIVPWQGGVTYDLMGKDSAFDIFQEFDDVYIGSPDVLKLTLNNEQMYHALLKIEQNYASISMLQQHDLELTVVSPKSEGGYPVITWSGYHAIFPMIQFRDTKWESNVMRYNFLGGIFVGLGINIFFTLLGTVTEKKVG